MRQDDRPVQCHQSLLLVSFRAPLLFRWLCRARPVENTAARLRTAKLWYRAVTKISLNGLRRTSAAGSVSAAGPVAHEAGTKAKINPMKNVGGQDLTSCRQFNGIQKT